MNYASLFVGCCSRQTSLVTPDGDAARVVATGTCGIVMLMGGRSRGTMRERQRRTRVSRDSECPAAARYRQPYFLWLFVFAPFSTFFSVLFWAASYMHPSLSHFIFFFRPPAVCPQTAVTARPAADHGPRAHSVHSPWHSQRSACPIELTQRLAELYASAGCGSISKPRKTGSITHHVTLVTASLGAVRSRIRDRRTVRRDDR